MKYYVNKYYINLLYRKDKNNKLEFYWKRPKGGVFFNKNELSALRPEHYNKWHTTKAFGWREEDLKPITEQEMFSAML